jgi:hypothetical protein
MPLALIGYPNATVTIGSTNGEEFGIRNPDVNGDGYNGFVFANLTIRGNNTGIKDTNNSYWRIVGSDFSCPNGSGEAACVMLDSASYVQFLGNSIHDSGAGGTKYYHSFYGTTNTLHVEVGWNHIYNNQSCRGVQFYSTGGSPQYDLIVHDNIIEGQECDGINFSTVDATQGPVEAYNNLVYHVGLGGPNDGLPNYACIASLGYGAAGGQELFYGNTLADCGSAGGSTAGAITVLSGSPATILTSNLIMQNPGEAVYSANSQLSLLSDTYNVELTNGTAGVVDSNYMPVPGSPALGAGTAYPGVLYDLAGNPRPQSGAQNAGAYVAAGTTASSSPTATLSNTNIGFGSQTVNTASAMQNVTLSNSGSTPLSIGSIALGGPNANQFNTSNNCGSSLAAGQSCNIQVQFAPTSTGSMQASITLISNASNPTQSISLTGSGTGSGTPLVTLSPAGIAFGNQTVSTTSGSQVITVTNSGSAVLDIGGVTIGGANASAFNLVSGCGSNLAPGASCAVTISFNPNSAGAMSAVLTLTDNGSPSTQSASLSGTGIAAATGTTIVAYALNNLYFYNIPVGATSAPSNITVTNIGNAAFTITSLSLTGAQPSSFQASSNCYAVAPGGSCSLFVIFNPQVTGLNAASIVITSNATDTLTSIPLLGHGY